MLSRLNRLKSERDFDFVFKKGRGFRAENLFLRVANNGRKCSRFGIVVSKNFFKKAVTRNKIKRRISEIIKENVPKIKEGNDVVVLARKGIDSLDSEKLKKKIERILEEANLFKKEFENGKINQKSSDIFNKNL